MKHRRCEKVLWKMFSGVYIDNWIMRLSNLRVSVDAINLRLEIFVWRLFAMTGPKNSTAVLLINIYIYRYRRITAIVPKNTGLSVRQS